jgi:hypothetical protein
VFDIGPHRIEWDETVFDIGPHRIEWDETVFDVGPHRIVWDEKVFDIGDNPIINTDPDPTGAPTAAPTTAEPTGSPVARVYEVIFAESFDQGFGDYFIDGDGRSSKVTLVSNADWVRGGTGQSVKIKDDREDASEIYTKDIDVSSYTEVMVSFWYKSKKVEEDEGLYFETKTAGGDWVKLEKFVRGSEWEKNGVSSDFNEGLVEFSVADTDVLAIKFSGWKLASLDYMYIDDVTVSGK